MPNADDGSAFVRFGTDAELLIYVSSQLLFLRAEHLDVGFMLSGFRRRHKVSQRPVCVLGRLPRRERRVSKVATTAWAFGHQQKPAPRPPVARTRPSAPTARPSAPTARPSAPTARPSAPAGGSRGGRGREPQGGRHRGGQAAWKRGPARGRPTPPLRWEQRRWPKHREGDPA